MNAFESLDAHFLSVYADPLIPIHDNKINFYDTSRTLWPVSGPFQANFRSCTSRGTLTNYAQSVAKTASCAIIRHRVRIVEHIILFLDVV